MGKLDDFEIVSTGCVFSLLDFGVFGTKALGTDLGFSRFAPIGLCVTGFFTTTLAGSVGRYACVGIGVVSSGDDIVFGILCLQSLQ